MHLIWTDKTVRNYAIQELTNFNALSLATKAKKAEKFVSMPLFARASFNLSRDVSVQSPTENKISEDKTGEFEECLEESRANYKKNKFI